MLVSLFPRSAVVVQVPAYAGPRGVVVYVVLWASYFFAIGYWWGPWITAFTAQRERDWDDLRSALGRAPTAEEFLARRRELRRARKRWGR